MTMGRRDAHHTVSELSCEKFYMDQKWRDERNCFEKFTWKRTESDAHNFSKKGGRHNLIMLFRKLSQKLNLFFSFS